MTDRWVEIPVAYSVTFMAFAKGVVEAIKELRTAVEALEASLDEAEKR